MKSGFELAVNTLVVFILTIVVLGIGISLFFKLKQGAEQINQDVSENIRSQIERQIIDSGSNVVIPFVTQEIGRGKVGSVYIGIQNSLDTDQTFRINVAPNVIEPHEPRFIDSDMTVSIKAHDQGFRRIWFSVPKDAELKQHIFNVTVCYNETGIGDLVCDPLSSGFYPPLHKVYIVAR